MSALPEFAAVSGEQPTYFRTTTGTRLHLPVCPHLQDSDAHLADAAELLAHPVCEWSLAQLGGYGREHFETVEDAMRRVGVPVEAHDEILHSLQFVRHDDVYVVHSLTYAALGYQGRSVAGFGKTYYWVGDKRVNLPIYVETSRSGHTDQHAYGGLCPVHSVTVSLTGECWSCP